MFVLENVCLFLIILDSQISKWSLLTRRGQGFVSCKNAPWNCWSSSLTTWRARAWFFVGKWPWDMRFVGVLLDYQACARLCFFCRNGPWQYLGRHSTQIFCTARNCMPEHGAAQGILGWGGSDKTTEMGIQSKTVWDCGVFQNEHVNYAKCWQRFKILKKC